jgi:hypothetical protein
VKFVMKPERSTGKGKPVRRNPPGPTAVLEVQAASAANVLASSGSSSKSAKNPPQPPVSLPAWARYADSRLKQFCTR